MGASRRDGPRSAFTAVELLLAVTLLGLMLASAAQVVTKSSDAYRTNRAIRRLEQRAHKALDRVLTELAATGVGYLDPPTVEGIPYTVLEYDTVLLQGTIAVAGPTSRLSLEMEAGEVDDGVDNNGNGLVDDRILVLTRDVGGPAEQRVVLCRGVRELLEGELPDGLDNNGNVLGDEPGFHLVRNGRALTVRLTLEGIGPQGEPLACTLETSAMMRN